MLNRDCESWCTVKYSVALARHALEETGFKTARGDLRTRTLPASAV